MRPLAARRRCEYWMELKQEIEAALETLEAFYFFTQGVKDEFAGHLEKVRAIHSYLLPSGYPKLLADIQRDIAGIRGHYGALAADQFYTELLREARAADGRGLIYISKLRIVRDLFSRYENSIVRWPHIKLHSFVVFEPKVGFQNMMFEVDGQLFHDAQFILYKARQAQGDAKTQRDLAPTRHRALHTLLRSIVTALFTFMEAYLNGIAFDCFQAHHDELELGDHDFLGEWNSTKKQRKFVKFDDKVFGYPPVIAKVKGRPAVDLSAFKPAHRITNDGKEIRDAITHPSAQYDPDDHTQKKMTLLAGLKLQEMESLYKDICEYVKFVEEALGYDPKESVPWLFDEFGFRDAKAETL
jgi:hypothetical protein